MQITTHPLGTHVFCKGVTIFHMEYTGEEFGQALAAQLRAERAASGLTQDELARRIGVSKMSVRRYLSGERPVAVPHFVELASALGLTIDELIRRSNERIQDG